MDSLTQATERMAAATNRASDAQYELGIAWAETILLERRAIAECVMHEIMLHLPESDPNQAFAVGMAVLPRVLNDLGLQTLIDAATLYADLPRSSSGE